MDHDIQELLAHGNREAAFERVLDRYQNRVFRLALTLLRSPEQAEDAAQDVFLKLWNALPLYNARASLSTWIYAITRNTCINALRRASYRRTLPLEDAVAAAAGAPEAAIDCRSLLAALPEQDRQILLLFYWEEKSYEEVAAMTNRPVGTVKSQLHRARRALARMLAGRPCG
jgi:RNA polymerase sigma-70 factor (ECF subfamily)